MESALLSTPQFLPSPNREVGGVLRNCQSSFYGNLTINRSFVGRDVSNHHRGSGIVASVVGKKVKTETVIPDPDYRIPVVLLGFAGGLVYTNNILPAAPVGLLGLLLLFQTTRVRFVFDDEALEVKIGEQLQEAGENVFVGGKNRWKYSTFLNWELWWPNFPILVYFKETQTKPEGQVHFFPVIFSGKQLYDVMVERAGPSKTSGPKQS
ncbi:Guanine nucleotide-binding protein-like 3-like protein [Actinidia chinensis var. chinensis]|uniref:Guanine nucleotide-binding protein-like 3-like protein n=1 Tax=Actinidia chinensis var. chinensis TaxID=1590841 RepID=A0A2R6S1U4_ACTCC|nr:Guanine nucleotide-binding protein-like 3-like protein [Actinidia chinensis var. chinensis]